MKRRILIVTPFFAPQSHAAVFRAYKLAKYLPEHGWEVHVLTVGTNYAYNEDASLLEALPRSVRVHHATYVEPTKRGISFALGVSDRRFSRIRAAADSGGASIGDGPNRSGPVPLSRRVGRLMRMAFNVPDAYWTWFLPALVKARRLVREHDIGLVMTSADPYTSHALGLALQHSGLRWVADLRDPHTHTHHAHSRLPWVFALQQELERAAAERADAVTVAAQSIALILKESYGLSDDSRFHFIPTGLDRELLQQPPAVRAKPYLIFCGEYLQDYGDAIFRLFAGALRDPELRALGYEFLVVGRREVNEPRLLPSLNELGLKEHVCFIDHVPQTELYALLAGASLATLPYGTRARWWCLPAKLVDYHALKKPVLAIVPNPSEARARLSETGLGIFLDGPDAQSTFNAALRAGGNSVRANESECSRYLVEQQVAAFARVFDGVLGDR